MIRKLFPEDSNQFDFLQKIFKSFDKEFIDRLEMFFPMWCVLSFKHYLIKSYDIYVIFNPIDIENNENYVFSLSSYDWFGVISIFLHTIFLLQFMKKYDWNYPTTMWVGENRIKDIALACKNLNLKKPLFVTDDQLVNNKIVKDTLKNLNSENITAEVYSNVKGNPTGTNVNEGVVFYKEKKSNRKTIFKC